MEKAAVLTKAAGTTRKDIQTIDCSWGEIRFETRPMGDLLMQKCAAPDEDRRPIGADKNIRNKRVFLNS